jgi:hypothetical protein
MLRAMSDGDSATTTTIEAGDASNARVDGMMAVVMFGSAAAVFHYAELRFNFDVNARDFNPLIVMVAVLAAIGMHFAGKAALGALRLRRFGASTLEASPLMRGKPFTFVLRTTREVEAQGPFAFCLRSIQTTRAGENARARQSIAWEATAHVPSEGVRSSSGIRATIDVPAGVATSEMEGGPTSVGVRWVLIARAPLPGADYKALFRVVMRSDEDD